MQKYAIIGGGPIGLFLSLALAKKLEEGLKEAQIDLFEKKSWPRDKVCGQGIMPSGVKLLNKYGIHFQEGLNSKAIDGISYIDGDLVINGSSKEKIYGVERCLLSSLLFEQVKKNNSINLYDHHKIEDITTLMNSYQYIFDCSGIHSIIKKKLNLDIPPKNRVRFGARVHYNQAPWNSKVEVYWEEKIEAYVTPVANNKIEIAYLWYEDRITKEPLLESRLLNLFPNLKSKLHASSNQGDFKAYGPFSSKSARLNFKNIFFVGDAYKFIDGITGEGLSIGLKAAEILARSHNKSLYIAKFKIKIIYANYAFWVNAALILTRYPLFRKYIFHLCSTFPKLFNKILSLNDFKFFIK
jgi:flavin-dependent dehydrogenase